MAKRRTAPTTNPIRQDLIDDLARPVAKDHSVGEGRRSSEPTPQKEPLDASNEPSAVGASERPISKTRSQPRKGAARTTVQVKARFVEEEAQEIEKLRKALSRSTGCTISTSHLTRALWMLALQAGEEVESGSVKAPKLKRPPHGNPVAMAEYEDRLSEFLLRAIKQVRAGG